VPVDDPTFSVEAISYEDPMKSLTIEQRALAPDGSPVAVTLERKTSYGLMGGLLGGGLGAGALGAAFGALASSVGGCADRGGQFGPSGQSMCIVGGLLGGMGAVMVISGLVVGGRPSVGFHVQPTLGLATAP
jgi:hypothetical protein